MVQNSVITVCENLLQALPKKAREIVERRFGIGRFKERKTLEAIGSSFGITRERVRQIEAYGLKKLRGEEVIKSGEAFRRLEEELSRRGGIAEEEKLLSSLASSAKERNYVRFLLVLGGDFERLKEDDEFRSRWMVDKTQAGLCHQTLRLLHKELAQREPQSEDGLRLLLAKIAKDVSGREFSEEVRATWLSISKLLGQNKFGEWGLRDSPFITPRGVRDLAYLVVRRHGSPLHFSEVTRAINKTLGESAHLQTVHNELIKDERFVLVGRGLYALLEWGYEPGTVREVMQTILNSSGPMTKEKFIERVLKERHVKTQTILINLQDKRHFKVLEDGRVALSA